MIEMVFFDIYGTLARFHPPREVTQQRAAGEFGLKPTKEGIDEGYRRAELFLSQWTAKHPIRTMNPEMLENFYARFEQIILSGAGFDVSLELAAQIWTKVCSQPHDDLALFPDVKPCLEILHKAGFRTAVISNMARSGRDVSADLDLSALMEFVVTSMDAGHEKPDPKIFHYALNKAKITPEQAVYVGDRPEADIKGASSANLKGVLIDRYGWHQDYIDGPKMGGLDTLPQTLTDINKKVDNAQ